MLNWDDELTAITPSEARAFRKVVGRKGRSEGTQGAPGNKVLLVEGITEAHLGSCFDAIAETIAEIANWQTPWSRKASLLRTAVLRRWIGALRGRAL